MKGYGQQCSQHRECRSVWECIGGVCTCPSTHYRDPIQDRCERSKWLNKYDVTLVLIYHLSDQPLMQIPVHKRYWKPLNRLIFFSILETGTPS